MPRPFFVTTPIFYVNAAPHIGHLYSAVLADVLKRWAEFNGRRAVFCTGTDEHGLKVQAAAAKAKVPPQEFCDNVSSTFKRLFDRTNISYTDYIRTTDPRHYTTVSKFWNILKEKDYIYKGKHEGWYSISDETFYPATQVEEIAHVDLGRIMVISNETGNRVEWSSELNYKFRLSEMRGKLLEWLKADPNVVLPRTRYSDVLSAVEGTPGEDTSLWMQDLSVSRPRSRLEWGIPVPDDPEHVIYVWLDALVNYWTVAGFHEAAEGQPIWPADCHVVGKDIIKFHAIYWPAFLMAAGMEPPKKIIAHAHFLINKQKMSKSIGNVVDPNALIDTYGVDAVRYFLARDGGLADDAEFSSKTVSSRYRKDLGGQLGNLVMRCSAPKVNVDMIIPSVKDLPTPLDMDRQLLSLIEALPDEVAQHMDQHDLGRALAAIFGVISETNRYWDFSQPWKLVGHQGDQVVAKNPERLRMVLYCAFRSLHSVGLLLQPFMPGAANAILSHLKVPLEERSMENARKVVRYPNSKDLVIGNPPMLFPKVLSETAF
ncbi:tRNA synthetases class I (M)-domain-containing protein [Cladochytrium replicatum]|nr:tRNA synthetases class I (M)-domain-containing protein [Cladochytrium replicatum]